MSSSDPDIYKIAFSGISGLTIENASKMLDVIGSEREFFLSSYKSLCEAFNSTSKILTDQYRESLLRRAEVNIASIAEKHIGFLYFNDDDYPQLLLNCDDAPLRLFYVGNISFADSPSLAVVGTRHSTPYGLSTVNHIISDLADQCKDLVIVSGAAYGTDISAHRAALKNGLRTVAVMAHGLSTVYPAAHRDDLRQIVLSGGAVITEYDFNAPVHKGNFLARNRIVAGLCNALLLVESKIKGGAMLTSSLAVEYGRQLYALPGRVNDIYSEGCNKMIASGAAMLINSAADILEDNGWGKPKEGLQREIFPDLNNDELAIVTHLKNNGPMAIAHLVSELSIAPGRLTGILTALEFKGVITTMPGAKVMLA